MMENSNLFHHILVPTDGSETSIVAGRMAVHLAANQGSQLTFVYIIDDPLASRLAKVTGQEASQVLDNFERSGQRCLDYLSRLASGVNLTSNQIIRRGEPYTEITALAIDQEVDLIVIGRVGCRGLRRTLIGSVTERVLEHAPCPVLVVK
jgi:nucleotide-binding universal stress UspA family protein